MAAPLPAAAWEGILQLLDAAVRLRAELELLEPVSAAIKLPKGIELKEEVDTSSDTVNEVSWVKIDKEIANKDETSTKDVYFDKNIASTDAESPSVTKTNKQTNIASESAIVSAEEVNGGLEKTSAKEHVCSICPFRHRLKRKLLAHRKTHGLENLASMYKHCEKCQQKVQKTDFYNHNLFKHGERTFQCDQCDKRYFNNSHLKEHIEISHDIETYQCDQCAMHPFRNKRRLSIHVNRHHTEKAFLCSECPFSTNETHMMNKHKQQRHTESEQFPKCDLCEYRNWNTQKIAQHIRKVHKGERIQCELCPAKFTVKSNMHAHMKNLHADNLVKTGIDNPQISFNERYNLAKNSFGGRRSSTDNG
jgi:hypothetical protein